MQLVLDLPQAESWDEANFFITSSNERALHFVKAWPDWQAPAAVIFGPPQSGKTYLARLWGSRSNAKFIGTSDLREHVWQAPFTPLVLEDADRSPYPETALFHHLNLAREHGSFILLTAQTPPGEWNVELSDLRSRLRSYPAVEIYQPDEEHLAGLILKHFSDRQIEIAPDVIPYLVARMERTMAAAQRITAHIDKLALSEHRKITRAFAAKVFSELSTAEDNEDNNQGEVS